MPNADPRRRQTAHDAARKPRPWWERGLHWIRRARLAGIAALIGAVALGWNLRDRDVAAPGVDIVALALDSGALEVTPSGHVVTLIANDAVIEVRPLDTRRHADGRHCRSFDVSHLTDPPQHETATACRDADGGWRTVAADQGANGDLLSAEAEARRIGHDWRAPPP